MSNIQELLLKMPKIELHAHLSGSVRDATILELIESQAVRKYETFTISEQQKLSKEDYVEQEIKKYPTGSKRSDLEKVFQCFSVLHSILNNKDTLRRVTREILDDFSKENVVYLELRTTPRHIYDNQEPKNLILSKKNYIDLVIEVIKEFEQQNKNGMIVRLILSVDRTRSIEDSLETISLGYKYKQDGNYVIGIDFSGHPKVSSFQKLQVLFNETRKLKLKTTVHVAETWQDPDIDFILKEFKPDRIGHAICLNDDYVNYLIDNPLPIEICPTSNLVTECISSLDKHLFIDFFTKSNKRYPLIICTDDFGIFNTTLTQEYLIIANNFNLTFHDLFSLSKNTVNYIFDTDKSVIRFLNDKFDLFAKEIQIQFKF